MIDSLTHAMTKFINSLAFQLISHLQVMKTITKEYKLFQFTEHLRTATYYIFTQDGHKWAFDVNSQLMQIWHLTVTDYTFS